MAASQARLIRERLQAILDTLPGITTVLTGAEDEITAAMLPAVRVLPGRVIRRQPNGARAHLITRAYRIVLYVARDDHASKLADQLTPITSAEDWLDVIPDALKACPRLELAGAGLAFVTGTEEVTVNDEPVKLQYRNGAYSGIVNDLPVTYVHLSTP